MPNTYCTPSASRHSTNTSDALRALTPAPYLNLVALRRRLLGALVFAVAAMGGLAVPQARAASAFYIRGAGTATASA